MKRNWTALVIGGALLCTLSVPAFAAEVPTPISSDATQETIAPLPYSVLYYGTIQAIRTEEDGTIKQLYLESERYGAYTMNISQETAWVDSGNHKAADPSTLKKGDSVYVFHSPIQTMSLPPQSHAYAVVWNVPQDAGSAMLHQVEKVTQENGQYKIQTDNGGLFILADDKTQVTDYAGNTLDLADIQEGDTLMAWYEGYAAVYPGQTHANALMRLTQDESHAITRVELVTMLYEKAGSPAVEGETAQYSDVTAQAPYADAVQWATQKQLISGYSDGTFGPENTMTREQLVTILWRYAGSPMLMDYTGLSQYSDVKEISSYAQPAMAWAHQQKLISGTEDGRIDPQGDATYAQAQAMVKGLQK